MGEPAARTSLVHANRDETRNWGEGCFEDGDSRTDRLFDVTCATCLDSCVANGPWWMAPAAAMQRAELGLRAMEARYTALVEAVDAALDADGRIDVGSGIDGVQLCLAMHGLRAAREALKGKE